MVSGLLRPDFQHTKNLTTLVRDLLTTGSSISDGLLHERRALAERRTPLSCHADGLHVRFVSDQNETTVIAVDGALSAPPRALASRAAALVRPQRICAHCAYLCICFPSHYQPRTAKPLISSNMLTRLLLAPQVLVTVGQSLCVLLKWVSIPRGSAMWASRLAGSGGLFL